MAPAAPDPKSGAVGESRQKVRRQRRTCNETCPKAAMLPGL